MPTVAPDKRVDSLENWLDDFRHKRQNTVERAVAANHRIPEFRAPNPSSTRPTPSSRPLASSSARRQPPAQAAHPNAWVRKPRSGTKKEKGRDQSLWGELKHLLQSAWNGQQHKKRTATEKKRARDAYYARAAAQQTPVPTPIYDAERRAAVERQQRLEDYHNFVKANLSEKVTYDVDSSTTRTPQKNERPIPPPLTLPQTTHHHHHHHPQQQGFPDPVITRKPLPTYKTELKEVPKHIVHISHNNNNNRNPPAASIKASVSNATTVRSSKRPQSQKKKNKGQGHDSRHVTRFADFIHQEPEETRRPAIIPPVASTSTVECGVCGAPPQKGSRRTENGITLCPSCQNPHRTVERPPSLLAKPLPKTSYNPNAPTPFSTSNSHGNARNDPPLSPSPRHPPRTDSLLPPHPRDSLWTTYSVPDIDALPVLSNPTSPSPSPSFTSSFPSSPSRTPPPASHSHSRSDSFPSYHPAYYYHHNPHRQNSTTNNTSVVKHPTYRTSSIYPEDDPGATMVDVPPVPGIPEGFVGGGKGKGVGMNGQKEKGVGQGKGKVQRRSSFYGFWERILE